MNTLHIYAQSHWHADAYIVGDTTSLTLLRDAISRAIEVGHGSAEAFVSDGEGFVVLVAKRDDAMTLDFLAVPYTDAEICAVETRANAIWPHEIDEIKAAMKEAEVGSPLGE